MKIRMICTYKGDQSLSAIAWELGLEVKDAAHITKCLKGTALMKSTTTKNGEGAISEMEKLLYYWYIFGSCVCDIRYHEQ
jgi:hypothetical protein